MSNKSNLTVTNSNMTRVSDLPKQAVEYAKTISINLLAAVDERWQAAKMQEGASNRHFAAHGLLLLSLKDDLPHGEFLKQLEAREFDERQSRRAMAYAKFIFSHEPQHVDKFLHEPRAKVFALNQADPEVVEEVLEGDVPLSKYTTRQLLNMVKAKDDVAKSLQTKLNDAETLLAAASKKRQLSDLKPATNIIREEALANVGTVQYGFAGLQKLWDEVEAEDPNAPERLLRMEQLWFAMHGAVSFGLKTLAHIAALAPEGMPTEISAAHVLTPEEADRWEQEWLTIQAGFKHKEAQRHDARVAELPRGRGRPAGSKNKDAGAGA